MRDIDYQRRSNETFFEYADRLVNGKKDGIYDLDHAEVWQLLFNEELNSHEARKRSYGLRALINKLKEEGFNNIESDELLNKFLKEKMELKKEKYKIQTEKLELNRLIRELSRIELWEEKMKNIANNLKPVEVPNHTLKYNSGKKVGITGIADPHYGKLIDIKGLMGEIINYYDSDVFEKRMWQLLDKLIKIIEKENLDYIDFYLLGDLIDGILRVSQLRSLQYGIIDSVMKFSEFMTVWLNELSKYIYLNVYSVLGNHSEIRALNSKSGDFPHENVEKLIMWYMQARLKDNPNIEIHDAKPRNLVNTLGLNVLSIHGQDEKNLERSLKDYITMYGIDIDIMLSGHLHSSHQKDIAIGNIGNVEFIQFPSICGTDEYAVKYKKSARPGSKLLVIEEGEGKAITYDIILK